MKNPKTLKFLILFFFNFQKKKLKKKKFENFFLRFFFFFKFSNFFSHFRKCRENAGRMAKKLLNLSVKTT